MKTLDVHVEEIGRQRFTAALPKLRALVRGCSFMAIDTEMGGLSLQDCRPSMMDSIQERYEQFRTNAQQFPVVQFGLSCFTWDADAQRFDVECFQFPIFPRFAKIEASELPDRRFLVQPRCLQYIRDHGFDLNAWIDDGVSYLSHADQVRFRSSLAKSAQPEVLRKFDPNVPALVTADTREFLTDITKKIKKRFAAQRVGGGSSNSSARGKHARRDSRGRRSQQPHRRGSNSSKDDDDDDIGDNDNGNDDESLRGGDAAGGGGAADATDAGDARMETSEQLGGKSHESKATPASSGFTHSPAELRAARKFLSTSLEPELRGKHRSSGSGDWPSAVFLSEPLAPFRRHVLLQHLQKLFPHVEAFDCKADNSGEDVQQNPWKRRVRLVATTSAKEKHCLLEAYEQIAQQELRDRNLELIGFTELMDVLVQSRKPLVGHNLLLDVMQCFEKFYQPLPPRCSEFLHELNAWLGGNADISDGDVKENAERVVTHGGVYDTKEMVTFAMETLDVFANNVQHSALEIVYDALSKTPFHGADIRIKGASASPQSPSSSLSLSSTSTLSPGSKSPPRPKQRVQAHQAGYDAFMTGFVFLRVCSGLGVPNSAIAALGGADTAAADALYVDGSDASRWEAVPLPLDARLLQFRNVLHVSHFLPAHTLRIPGPFPDESETPSRACYLRLHLVRTAAGGSLKTFHIKQCIGWALNLPSPKHVQVHWEGKQWVYVALPTPALAEQLLRVRDGTSEREGSPADPMPSIGCVDIYRCAVSASVVGASSDRESTAAAARAAEDAELEAEKKQAKRRK